MGLVGSIFAIGMALVSLIAYFARRIDSKNELRDLRKHVQPVRQITDAEREAVLAAFDVRIAAGAPVYRVQGTAYEHRLTMNGQPIRHYLIGDLEVKPFPGWEAYLARHNTCDVALGPGVALPLSLNHVTLLETAAEHIREARMDTRLRHARSGVALEPTSDSREVSSTTLGAKRMETPAEAVLRDTWAGSAAGWAMLLGLGGIGLTIVPALQPGDQIFMAVPALFCMASGALLLYLRLAHPTGRPLEIRTLRGPLILAAPAAQGNPGQQPRIGGLPVRYPPHWLPHLAHADGRMCEVEVGLNHEIVRHERLSLYEERRRFPVQRWGWHLVLTIASAVAFALALSMVWPLDDTLSRIAADSRGVRTLRSTTPAALLALRPQPWDRLAIDGTAECLPPVDHEDNEGYATLAEQLDKGWLGNCRRLGWRTRPIDLEAYPLPAGLLVLQNFAQNLRTLPDADLPPSSALQHDDLDQEATPAPQEMPDLPVPVTDLRQPILELDRFCSHGDDEACAPARALMAALAGHGNDWRGAVDHARAGTLPDVRAPARQLQSLADQIDELLQPAIWQARLALWRKAHDAAPPDLVLELQVPHMAWDLTGQKGDTALAGLMSQGFTFHGAVARLRDDEHGHPELVVRTWTDSPTRMAIGLPLLLGLLALMSALANGIALWRMRHRRETRRMARETYVKEWLQ